MTSRKRNNTSVSNDAVSQDALVSKQSIPPQTRRTERERRAQRSVNKRRHLLETLESRQLLAGPQLIGIQPNEGDLIVNNSVRDVAPRALTFRFDQDQQIDEATLGGIRITRAGDDGLLDTADDIRIEPGLVSLGDNVTNEVVVRFAEPLQNDLYKAEVFGFDDDGLGVTGLRNLDGEFFQPSVDGKRIETTKFELRLGAQIESVVPQPVIRNEDGSLTQNRNEIVVYFNEDPLFVEDEAAGGVISIGGQQITIAADFVGRSFDDVQVIFTAAGTAGNATAAFDEDARTLTVTYPVGTSFAGIASAISNIDDFEATVTGGSASAVFVAPTDPNVRFEITGTPSLRSAENPRFYQLLLTQDTVRTTDDALYFPDKVVYDPATFTARLFFADDLNELGTDADGFAGVSAAGGTFRLRIGTAVDERVDLILPPTDVAVNPVATTDFGYEGLKVFFIDRGVGESASGRTVSFVDTGAAGLSVSLDASNNVVFNFGGDSPTVNDLQDIVTATPAVRAVIRVRWEYVGPGMGGDLVVRDNVVGAAPLTLFAVGDSLSTALDVGAFRESGGIQSLVFSETISALPVRTDVDLYRFEVSLDDRDRVGTLTAETFAERLDDASLLDTTLTLFQEVSASGTSNFGRGVPLAVRFDAIAPGQAGNNARIDFVLTNRSSGDNEIRIRQVFDTQGNIVPNVIQVDLPRASASASVTAGDLVSAINSSPIASTIFRASISAGQASDSILETELSQRSVTLSGGGVSQLARNDDYFSEDSRLIANLANGVYYVGITASGNNTYDPSISGTGFGGESTGEYELHLKFEPRVDEANAIRDLDDPRTGVPGTIIDGDGDGSAGGVHDFWFQTRALDRVMEFTQSGQAVTPGQTLQIISASGISRTYEFVPTGGTAIPGNIAVAYNPGTSGIATPAGSLAQSLRNAIQSQRTQTGVSASVDGTSLMFSGEQRLVFSNNFRAGAALGRTIFVDKTASPNADGSLELPFNNISNSAVANAFSAALPGDIVRIVGNGGADFDITTEDDNFSYQIGVSNVGGSTLEDGRQMEVPEGVTTMIDAGAVFKLRNARIGVGSSTVQTSRSGGALQVLGTPRLVQLSAQGDVVDTTLLGDEDTTGLGYEDGSVIFTSLRDRNADTPAAGNGAQAAPGDWGGIVFRRDLDSAQGLSDLEDQGIFLQLVNHAEIRYGGSSNIVIDSNQVQINPITIDGLRPTISYSEIYFSQDAALSATPDSFKEESYQSPVFQRAGEFTADYDRVGPNIYRNLLLDNSINGMFIRSGSDAEGNPRTLTVAGRFDDTDVVHYLASNLIVEGTPGGPIADGVRPSLENVSARQIGGGALDASTSAGNPNYEYRMTFVDSNGFESLATSNAETFQFEIMDNNSSLELFGLPVVDSNSDYLSRRLYRAEIRDASGNLVPAGSRQYVLVAELDGSTTTYLDDGEQLSGVLDLTRSGVRGRLDGSLVMDPNLVVKLRGSRIEIGPDAQLLAEGVQRNPIILTSSLDDRFGAGGTFDTNFDNGTAAGAAVPDRGDWAGIYAAPGANVSLDYTTIAFGGGLSLLEGSSTVGIAPLELHNATARVTNSRFEFNDSGQGGSADPTLGGLEVNAPSIIFVRDSQPIVVGNEFVDNRGSLININNGSLTADSNTDFGRQTGSSDQIIGLNDNRGPLIRRNAYDVVPADDPDDRQVSAIEIVGGGVLTQSLVFDDTDIVHVVSESLVVGNQSTGGGLRLISRGDESLVVKLTGSGNANSPTDGTGITATGSVSSDPNRIGGSVQIIGRPGAPVVLTSIADDTVGAGRSINGEQFTDTNGDSFGSRPTPNDWRSVLIDQYSNDRNVDVVLEQELPTAIAPGANAEFGKAEVLGELAPNQFSSDDVRRLGFEVEGFLSSPTDVDTYTFKGTPGTEVWIDVDGTSFSLDTVIEVLDANGNLLARSDNSAAEVAGISEIAIFDSSVAGIVTPLATGVFATATDVGSTNPLDAGIHLRLPGVVTAGAPASTYGFRIRSASTDPNDSTGGLTFGAYKVQVRLQQEQESPGSVVRYSDIRYANNGVHVRGLPGSSPLLGEAQENESVVAPTIPDDPLSFETAEVISDTLTQNGAFYASNDQIEPQGYFTDSEQPFARPQNLGNLAYNKNNVISVGGSLQNDFFGGAFNDANDIDFYQVDINPNDFGLTQFPSAIFDIDYADGYANRPDTRLSIFYDPDGEGNPQPAHLVYIGSASNVAEDQPSPGASNGLIEQLSRGSMTTNDPLIGPVAVREGTYYIAVTSEGVLPTELTEEILLRVEPIDSLARIVEDRVDNSVPLTDVQIPELFPNAAIAASQFSVSGLQANERGHGDPRLFAEPGALIPEFGLPGGDIPSTLAGALDVRSLPFSLSYDVNIGTQAVTQFGQTAVRQNSSNVIPHVSIQGSLSSLLDTADVYTFDITAPNTRVVFDIDDGFDPSIGPYDTDVDTVFQGNILPSVDLSFGLINLTTNVITTITDSAPQDGAFGSNSASASDPTFGALSPDSPDPFFDQLFNPGQYAVVVYPAGSTLALDDTTGEVVITPNDVADDDGYSFGDYELHVSITDGDTSLTGLVNDSLYYNPATATADGNLASNLFDLSNYSAADLPNFYFNYQYSPGAGDAVTYTITSYSDATRATEVNQVVSSSEFVGDGQWRQAVVDLGGFAGEEFIEVSFQYTRAGGTGQGLFLDDFIIGFAERGEEVFNADPGDHSFTGAGTGTGGKYQLEVRRGTEYATNVGGTKSLLRSFDTNARHDEAITILAPSGQQVADAAAGLTDGLIFEVSDQTVTQKFQFVVDGVGGTQFDAIPVRISATDTSAQVGNRIRAAIGLAGLLDVEAAPSSGNSLTGSSDNRINLFGATGGSFAVLNQFSDDPGTGVPLATSGGQVTLSAVVFRGTGDENYLRTQGQVIIEQNRVSDARAIGIWNEAGDRDTDTEDLRIVGENLIVPQEPFFGSVAEPYLPDYRDDYFGSFFGGYNPYLNLPEVGNPAQGAVRNLPEDNDFVLGGLAPGIVIRNNVVDQAGFTGVKVDGDPRPIVISSIFEGIDGLPIPDGYTFAIDAGGTRVVFEFEDVADVDLPSGGSAGAAGNGYHDGHVPIFYRHPDGMSPAAYYNSTDVPTGDDPRNQPYSSIELMTAIHTAIQGSILVTNGLVELVDTAIGPDPFQRNRALEVEGYLVDRGGAGTAFAQANAATFPNAAVYVYGASAIYDSGRFLRPATVSTPGGYGGLNFSLAPISDAVQPVTQIVNNTIYGSDGVEAQFAEAANREGDDLLAGAIDTKIGRSHTGPYVDTADLAAVSNGVANSDVDFFKVELVVGDRLIVDIDTPNSNVDSVLQLFNADGERIFIGIDDDGNPTTFVEDGTAPDHLEPLSTPFSVTTNAGGQAGGNVSDFVDANDADPFLDYTALETGTYYVAVSQSGNLDFNPIEIAGRTGGSDTAGDGEYTIGIQTYAPRSFVMSLDNGFELNGAAAGPITDGGTKAAALIGTTFTVTQIPDFPNGVPAQPANAVQTVGNQITFEFTDLAANTLILPNGNVNVPLLVDGTNGYRVPSIMRAIQEAVRGLQDPIDDIDIPTIPNHEDGNGPFGRSGPIKRATATALGGISGDNSGIINLQDRGGMPHYTSGFLTDFGNGFGHDRHEDLPDREGNVIPQGTLTDGDGTTELYVLWENIAEIHLSQEAINAGLKLTPNEQDPLYPLIQNTPPIPELGFARDADQLLIENGILATTGASPTIMNNVVVNAHQSIVAEETSYYGFGKRVVNTFDANIKPSEVILVGNAYQYDEPRNTLIRYDVSFNIEIENPFDVVDISTSTDDVTGSTNIVSEASDFNYLINNDDVLLRNPAGNDFRPDIGSIIIDAGISELISRDSLNSALQSVGIRSSNVTAPARDVDGVLRADEPNVAPPGGLGPNPFVDRGAVELADFLGPVATFDSPKDNDASGIDRDPAVSFLAFDDGTFAEFRIQLQDLGDASDPFIGSGIDDTTVSVPAIDGLRKRGANVLLFEDGRLLEEGINYTFSYDETRNVITLRPLAGIWSNESAYHIELNNQDRSVVLVPESSQVSDGDRVEITDLNGGTFVFEFEAGYSLFVPEPITLVVPQVGTNSGGVRDGDLFTIYDGVNPPIVFELNNDGTTLPGTIPVLLTTQPTPADADALETYLAQIAANVAAAIQSQVEAGNLDADVRVIDNTVVVGTEPGATAVTSSGGLQQLSRTLALNLPAVDIGTVGGIADGDTFTISNGEVTTTFEFNYAGTLSNGSNVEIPLTVGDTPAQAAITIRDTVAQAPLGLTPMLFASSPTSVFLNLPEDGTAVVNQGQLQVVGLSRTPNDGDTLRVTPNDGGPEYVLELNRTDERNANGDIEPDEPLEPNVAVDLTRATTATELAGRIANALQGLPPVGGLVLSEIRPIPGGGLSIGGEEGLVLGTAGTSIEVLGEPSVTGSTTIEVFGPLLLTLPLVGETGIATGSVLVLQDQLGQDVVFEFRNDSQPIATNVPGAIPVNYPAFTNSDVVRDALRDAINAATIGIVAVDAGPGRLSLGRITDQRVSLAGGTFGGVVAPGLPNASLRRGIVTDGEVLTIAQGTISVNYEFQAANGGGSVTPGNIPVNFTAGSTVADIAVALAAAINNNKNGLSVNAVASVDDTGAFTGQVELNDRPGTIVTVAGNGNLFIQGVPGGATPIRISPSFSATEIKEALINAIASLDQSDRPASERITATDRGGSSFFVTGATSFSGPVESYSLPAIADLAGNPLRANRSDNTTAFTLLLPTVGLDFGDLPDPVAGVNGRYPTRLASDGARHVVTNDLKLGQYIDVNGDGVSTPGADGDDLSITISSVGTLFTTRLDGSAAEIIINSGTVDPRLRDGDLITINTGVSEATLEFDINGRFDEDNFAISPADPTSSASIAAAIVAAIAESPLDPARVSSTSSTVRVDSDDEDGVIFTSTTNPDGILNAGVAMPIEVGVTGAGVLEAWIDFNADGDFDDPGEQIIPVSSDPALADRRSELCPVNLADAPSNIFSDTGSVSTRSFCIVVPPTTAAPTQPVNTYARFRVSREGNLSPTGLALSGEVEDYQIRLLPGLPPTLTNAQANRTFTTQEDRQLQALDDTGNATTSPNDNGLLAGIVDSDGDNVEIFAEDTGERTILTAAGNPAGVLDLSSDGRFTFLPEADFNGTVTFAARVTDKKPLDPSSELVSSRPVSVTINVTPVNDPPIALVNDVIVTRTINEDEIQYFDIEDGAIIIDGQPADGLIGDKYAAGPVNEGTQPLVIRSVTSSRGTNQSSLGGIVNILDGGTRIEYIPPADYNGAVPDTFNYVVADIPAEGVLGEEAAKLGTVTISINPVNDAPRPRDDSFQGQEDVVLLIPINGTAAAPGILDNDTAGPLDETQPPNNQTISLVTNQFPITTNQGGTVTIQNGQLRYQPPGLFSGIDTFEYQISDSLGEVGSATVSVNLSGVNNNPRFIGINGNANVNSITRDESKNQAERDDFNLSTWFSDPEGDALTYSVVSDNPSVAQVSLNDSSLRLTYPPFAFGQASLTVVATDPSGASATVVIPVTVTNTPDPPELISTLNPLTGSEALGEAAGLVTADLGGVFRDRDNEPLTYSVLELDGVVNPSAAAIAAHPLVDSITFDGNQLRIVLKPNQSGTAQISIAASDGSSQVSDSFQLVITPTPDAPIARNDSYFVPVGSSLQIINPASGLLRNDSDADNDAIRVDLSTVAGGAVPGLVEINEDGTFTYQNDTGTVGESFTFTYRLLDATGTPSNTATVTFTLNQSRYQNPIADMTQDVNADGKISAIDALRIINFLNRRLVNGGTNFVPTSEIGAPPPDFYDVDGNGRVTSLDALRVVNRLAEINNRVLNPSAEGEFVASSITDSPLATLAATSVTSSYASAGVVGLPSRQVEQTEESVSLSVDNVRDSLMANGFEISSATNEIAVESFEADEPAPSSTEGVDEALTSLFDDLDVSAAMLGDD
ncbi:hypothetical protein Pla22_42670 [Rubripirellula amarantea]|uniref:Dockerin type I repeat protein n=1 Tax=Rubripirellula amarantea TaxID=2527999 RepID=A0A5C5WG42_9BACT|nr:tandem-95 repeat protein [Rubripirellula amarantea]TWT49075.1 hypothetical protein Pla22_42670 [Rubripirellula amarantea]